MNTKKAIVLGTLGAILIGLVSFFASKYIKSTNRITTTYADESIKKGKIQSEMLNTGYTFDINSNKTNPNTSIDITPTTTQEHTTKPNTLTNSSWYAKGDTINTTQFQTETTFNINFAVGDINYTYTSITIGPNTIKFNETTVYNNGWAYPVYKKTTTITGGTDVENQNLIDFIWENYYSSNYRYYTYHQTYSTSYLGIESYFASQKTYTNNTITSEGIFLCKIQSTGLTTELFMETFSVAPYLEIDWLSNTIINYGEWTNEIKFSKLNYISNLNPTTLADKRKAYENYYNNIPNKQNVYSGTWNFKPTETNHNWINDSYYTNETGTRCFKITNGSAHPGPVWTLQNTDPAVNIYSQGRANYIAVYFKCQVKDYYPAPADDPNTNFDQYHYWYYQTATQSAFTGYGISSNPVIPPDIENGNFMSLTGMILNILTLPFTFLSQAFNLTLWADTPWAFNIKNAIFVMIGIFTFLFIIKLFTRGFDSLGEYTGSISKNKANRSQAKLNKEKAKSIKQDRKDKKE